VPLPAWLSYASDKLGCTRAVPGALRMGMDQVAAPSWLTVKRGVETRPLDED
jgi:hypothetical protein